MAVWHTFDVLDYTNMLIEEVTMEYPIAVTGILHLPLVTCQIVNIVQCL